MTDSLRKKAERGALWSFIDAASNRIVQFVIGVILARLLLPEQFALLAMLAIFIAVAQAFLDSGFGLALIQKKEVTKADTSSVFYFNLAIGVALTGLMYLAAPWIASFYNRPDLCPLTRAMSLVFTINSFGVVQSAMLSRNVAFKVQTKISLISAICSGSIGVTMAYRGYGVWSLVCQQISRGVFNVVLLWVFNRWRPSLVFSLSALRQMFTFGSRMLASNLLDRVFNNIYSVLIGKMFSPSDLGYYDRAFRTQQLPSMTLTSVVTRVSLPVFSSIQDDNIRLKKGLQRTLCLLMFLIAPVMVLLAVTASPFVTVLLTEKWLPCVPYLRVLCVLGILYPLHAVNLNILVAKGRSDLFLRLEMLKKGLILCNVLVSWRWGIMAIIVGQIVASSVSYFLNSYYSGRLLGYSARRQLRDMAAYLLPAVVVGAGVYALQYAGLPGMRSLLAAQVVSGLAAYLLLCGLLRLPAFLDARRVVVERVPLLARFVA